jgi:hypothetical protein
MAAGNLVGRASVRRGGGARAITPPACASEGPIFRRSPETPAVFPRVAAAVHLRSWLTNAVASDQPRVRDGPLKPARQHSQNSRAQSQLKPFSFI